VAARRPKRSPKRTRVARWGWIAGKYAGYPNRSIPDFLQTFVDSSLDLSDDVLEQEVRPVRATAAHKLARGPNRGPVADAPENPLIWSDWLRLDEVGLGLHKLLIRIPNDGLPLDDLVAYLRELPGIRQVIETQEDNEVFAVALCRNEAEKQDLRALIRERAPAGVSVRMHVIRLEDQSPAIRTWLELARREARAVDEE
jgi:hypothetical protein